MNTSALTFSKGQFDGQASFVSIIWCYFCGELISAAALLSQLTLMAGFDTFSTHLQRKILKESQISNLVLFFSFPAFSPSVSSLPLIIPTDVLSVFSPHPSLSLPPLYFMHPLGCGGW